MALAAPPLNLSTLSCMIEQCYAAVSSGDWRPFLTQLMERTQSNKSLLLLNSLQDKRPAFINIVTNFEYPAEVALAYQQNTTLDPLYDDVRFRGEGEIIEPSKLIDKERYVQNPFYQEIFIPMRTYHALGLIALRDGIQDAAVIVNRGPDEQAYAKEDYQLFSLLRPHIQQALRLFTMVQRLQTHNDVLQTMLEQSERGLLVVDASGCIHLKNSKAAEIITQHPLFIADTQHLRLAEPCLQQQLQLLLTNQSMEEKLSNGKSVLTLHHHVMLCQLSCVPLRLLLHQEAANDHLFLITLSPQPVPDWQFFSREYGLTPKEGALVQQLFQGQRLPDLSVQQNVSYHTLRSHLQSVFSKCRINSQSELMVLAQGFCR